MISSFAPAGANEELAVGEFLRLPSFTLPIRHQAGGEFWAFTPFRALVIDGRQVTQRHLEGAAFSGTIATVGTTTQGWLMGTTDGVWQVRTNERDLRHLPELGTEGVYRLANDLAFTETSVFRLDKPWERYTFPNARFSDINDGYQVGDTLYLATRRGVRRLLWATRTWDEAPLGGGAERGHLVRFILPPEQNKIDYPDSMRLRTRTLLVGERSVFYEEPASKQWIAIEGVVFPKFRQANSDSAYRRLGSVLFQTELGLRSPERAYRRWLVAPTGVCEMVIPEGDVPYSRKQYPLVGDVRDTRVDSVFVWVGTTNDLYVIDREFDSVDRFFGQDDLFVWGFLGKPEGFVNTVKGVERGWYSVTSAGMTEVFQTSWTWDAYGFDRFEVHDVLCAVPDVDGFWIGTRKGLRWFDADARAWRPSVPPEELASTPIYKMEWQGNELYALARTGIYSRARLSRRWVQVAPFE